jgi:hypothetical protein
LLVLVDYFTKWTEAYPMPNQEAVTVADKFVKEFICRWGVPSSLHTDQGRQFESKIFQEVCNLLQIDKTCTTSFHPSSNGLVERMNRTLENMLKNFVSDHQRDWDRYVPMVLMAYRSTVHDSTGVSPNRMMLGREVTLPLDLMFGCPPAEMPKDSVEYVAELEESLEKAHAYAREKLKKAAERQKRIHDRLVKGSPYQPGDMVWLFNPLRKVGKSPKLQCYWEGPFKVLRRMGNVLYQIQRSAKTKPKVVHFDRLKKCLKGGGATSKGLLPYLDDKGNDIRGTRGHMLSRDESKAAEPMREPRSAAQWYQADAGVGLNSGTGLAQAGVLREQFDPQRELQDDDPERVLHNTHSWKGPRAGEEEFQERTGHPDLDSGEVAPTTLQEPEPEVSSSDSERNTRIEDGPQTTSVVRDMPDLDEISTPSEDILAEVAVEINLEEEEDPAEAARVGTDTAKLRPTEPEHQIRRSSRARRPPNRLSY